MNTMNNKPAFNGNQALLGLLILKSTELLYFVLVAAFCLPFLGGVYIIANTLFNPNNPDAVRTRKFTELVQKCKRESYEKYGHSNLEQCTVWANTIVPIYGNL